jgi:hypothetical protein
MHHLVFDKLRCGSPLVCSSPGQPGTERIQVPDHLTSGFGSLPEIVLGQDQLMDSSGHLIGPSTETEISDSSDDSVSSDCSIDSVASRKCGHDANGQCPSSNDDIIHCVQNSDEFVHNSSANGEAVFCAGHSQVKLEFDR